MISVEVAPKTEPCADIQDQSSMAIDDPCPSILGLGENGANAGTPISELVLLPKAVPPTH